MTDGSPYLSRTGQILQWCIINAEAPLTIYLQVNDNNEQKDNGHYAGVDQIYVLPREKPEPYAEQDENDHRKDDIGGQGQVHP